MSGLTSDLSAALSRSRDEIFADGLPLTQSLKADRMATKVFLLSELTRTWKAVAVGESKTWKDQEAIQDAVDEVCEIFPTMKLEEILLVFRTIRRGEVNIYGRLDTPTLIEQLRKYEDTYTTTFREAAARQRPTDDSPRGGRSVSEAIAEILPTLRNDDGRTSEMWLRGANNMTPREREQLQERDCQRRNAQREELDEAWVKGGTLTDHERQQIRKEAASQAKGQAEAQGSGSTTEEDARTAQSQGR